MNFTCNEALPGKLGGNLVLKLLVCVLQVANHNGYRLVGSTEVLGPLGAGGLPWSLALSSGGHQTLSPNPHGQDSQHVQSIVPDLLQKSEPLLFEDLLSCCITGLAL